MSALLEIEDLRVDVRHAAARPFAPSKASTSRSMPREIVGLVGESGSGKSVTALALMGLVDFPGRVRARRMAFAGRDLLTASAEARRALVGRDIAMIFQDPLASLDPCYTVGLPARRGAEAARQRRRAGATPPSAAHARSSCCAKSRSPTRRRDCARIRTSCPAAWRSA